MNMIIIQQVRVNSSCVKREVSDMDIVPLSLVESNSMHQEQSLRSNIIGVPDVHQVRCHAVARGQDASFRRLVA